MAANYCKVCDVELEIGATGYCSQPRCRAEQIKEIAENNKATLKMSLPKNPNLITKTTPIILKKKIMSPEDLLYKKLYEASQKENEHLKVLYHEIKGEKDALKVSVDTLEQKHKYEIANFESLKAIAIKEAALESGNGLGGLNTEKITGILSALLPNGIESIGNLFSKGAAAPAQIPQSVIPDPAALAGLGSNEQAKISNIVSVLQDQTACTNPGEIIQLYEHLLVVNNVEPSKMKAIKLIIQKSYNEAKAKFNQ